jgi:hypothetical protein
MSADIDALIAEANDECYLCIRARAALAPVDPAKAQPNGT